MNFDVEVFGAFPYWLYDIKNSKMKLLQSVFIFIRKISTKCAVSLFKDLAL